MEENIAQTLLERNKFISHLENDLSKNEKNLEDKKGEIEKLTQTIKHIKFLGRKIIHTAEYLLEKKCHPYSFQVLATIDQTVDSLEEKKEMCKEHLEKYQEIERQLKDRIELLVGKSDSVCDMPEKIVSEKGVAVRVGEFYEILEFED